MPDSDRLTRADFLPAAALYCVVMVLLHLTAALASPAFEKSRGRASRDKICRANIKQIADAKAEYAREHRLTEGAPLPDGCLWAENGFLKYLPECPSGGDYTLAAVGIKPTCSAGGKHALD